MKVILTIILLYISTSLMEWYVHKYMLHDENNKLTKIINSFISKIYSKIHGIEQPDNHINHHTITHNDNKVYTEDEVWATADCTKKEVKEFLESMNSQQFKEIEEFFESMPKLSHTIKVTNPKTKVESDVVLEGLASFFV